jgi:hypothetical protein
MQDDIIAKLNSLTVANGFSEDVSILDGYMVHYAKDLLAKEDGIGFPCIAVQPHADTLILHPSQDKAKVSRILKVIGAVDATDRTTVNANIISWF